MSVSELKKMAVQIKQHKYAAPDVDSDEEYLPENIGYFDIAIITITIAFLIFITITITLMLLLLLQIRMLTVAAHLRMSMVWT